MDHGGLSPDMIGVPKSEIRQAGVADPESSDSDDSGSEIAAQDESAVGDAEIADATQQEPNYQR